MKFHRNLGAAAVSEEKAELSEKCDFHFSDAVAREPQFNRCRCTPYTTGGVWRVAPVPLPKVWAAGPYLQNTLSQVSGGGPHRSHT